VGIEESHLEIVELALSGHRDSLNLLAQIVQAPLRSYVLRIAYKSDIVDDIVQETLLEMFKILRQLKRADHFWPWLCKIALNKIRNHSRTESNHQHLLKGHFEELAAKSPKRDSVASAIYEEFRECIFQAMSGLSEKQKAVLSMRCYEKMPYSEIAKVMSMSELGCRLLFVRAKKKLQHKLFRLGYGQKSLLVALVLFGKLTAPSEAAAADVCITPGMLGGGAVATGIAVMSNKAILILAAGGAVVAGTLSVTNHSSDLKTNQSNLPVFSATSKNSIIDNRTHVDHGYYFFPRGKQGPLITRLVVHDGQNIVQKLQNDAGNYSYDTRRQVVTVDNYHYWNSDLSVMRLPTDNADLESFLAQIEGRMPYSHAIKSDSLNLFVVASGDEEQQDVSFVAKNYEALMEERFQYNWTERAGVRDNRDLLHRQGWCYFKMQGHLHGRTITGSGQLPLVYREIVEHPAWLKIVIDDKRTLIDTQAGAVMLNAAGNATFAYPPGAFLCGLNRPWMGLHVIDTIRRDAAIRHIQFTSKLAGPGKTGLVSLLMPEGKILYVVDMEKDLIERIQFFDLTGSTTGEILFEYLNPDKAGNSEFTQPQLPFHTGSGKTEQLHWISALAEDSLQFE
jgi:RNA polymerase sigma factor (sigma-70 family)